MLILVNAPLTVLIMSAYSAFAIVFGVCRTDRLQLKDRLCLKDKRPLRSKMIMFEPLRREGDKNFKDRFAFAKPRYQMSRCDIKSSVVSALRKTDHALSLFRVGRVFRGTRSRKTMQRYNIFMRKANFPVRFWNQNSIFTTQGALSSNRNLHIPKVPAPLSCTASRDGGRPRSSCVRNACVFLVSPTVNYFGTFIRLSAFSLHLVAFHSVIMPA